MTDHNKEECNNPVPDPMYSKDNFKNITFHCENCGARVICMVKNGKEEWVHWNHKLIKELL